jgi:hypothetical protein
VGGFLGDEVDEEQPKAAGHSIEVGRKIGGRKISEAGAWEIFLPAIFLPIKLQQLTCGQRFLGVGGFLGDEVDEEQPKVAGHSIEVGRKIGGRKISEAEAWEIFCPQSSCP